MKENPTNLLEPTPWDTSAMFCVRAWRGSKVSLFWRRMTAAIALAVLALDSNGVTFGADEGTLTDRFRLEFTSRNPVLTRIRILEFKRLSPKNGSGAYIYLVHAIRPDMNFVGKFEDEQFGVFLVNVDQNRIVKVLDVFNTPRWLDFDIKIKRVSPSGVEVVGEGATYGDQPFAKTYNLRRVK